MGAAIFIGLAATVLSIWLLMVATLTTLEMLRSQRAEAPTAAFAGSGDDRSLDPIVLHRPRHIILSKRRSSRKPGSSVGSSAIEVNGSGGSGGSDGSIAVPPSSSLPPPLPLVPGLFVYGDSTVDVGNNNYLQTVARANLAPYGRDFDTHLPTGRFSNGRLSVDYLALFLGLPFSSPLLSRMNISSLMQGVNFASAGAGILNPSGSDLGQHIPMAEQVQHIVEVQQRLASRLGDDAAADVISKSIHYISIGSNDFIHYYLRNVSDVQKKMTNFEFNQLLISSLIGYIEDMYSRGVRKVVAIGLGPLGCVPFYLYSFNQTSSGCVDNINFMIAEFNNALRITAQSLAMKHRNLKIIYCDVFQSLMPIVRTPLDYGFITSRGACCGAGRFGGWMMCMFPQMACSNASSYLWWDEFHPTDRANFFLARDIWSGRVCEPGGLRDLASV